MNIRTLRQFKSYVMWNKINETADATTRSSPRQIRFLLFYRFTCPFVSN